MRSLRRYIVSAEGGYNPELDVRLICSINICLSFYDPTMLELCIYRSTVSLSFPTEDLVYFVVRPFIDEAYCGEEAMLDIIYRLSKSAIIFYFGVYSVRLSSGCLSIGTIDKM